MPDHMVGFRKRPQERQYYAPFHEFGHTLSSLVHGSAEGVGLPEVRVGSVEDQGLAATELMVKEPGEPLVPTLSHQGRHFNIDTRIVVNVEMFGLEHLEIKVLILDPVATEILGLHLLRDDNKADAAG